MKKFKPVIRGNFNQAGLANAARAAATAIHRKPILTFMLTGQILVDAKGNITEDDENGELREIEIDYHFRIDPSKIKPSHNNHIAAQRDRLNAAQRMMEKIAIAGGAIEGNKRVTREDLPDADILAECYTDMDDAVDDRLLACVMVDENGNTDWDYCDANGAPINLTKDLLFKDLRMSEAIHAAFMKWYSPTKGQSATATGMKMDSGTTDTAQSSTPPDAHNPANSTPNPSSSDSPMRSIAPENNGTIS